MKKIISLFLTATLLVSLNTSIVKAENTVLFGTSRGVASDEGISVVLNGNTISFDQPPIIMDGRTLVPLRAIFEAMGATVDWDQSTSTVISQRGSTIIKLSIGSNILYKNDTEIYLDVAAHIVNDRTLVPVRAIAEAFGAEVGWDGDTRTVYVNDRIAVSEDAFRKLAEIVKNYGEYDAEANWYSIGYDLDIEEVENAYISINYTPGENSLYFYLEADFDDYYTYVDFYLTSVYGGVTSWAVGNDESEDYITWTYDENSYYVEESTLSDEMVEDAKSVVNETIDAFNDLLDEIGSGISIQELGIGYFN